ncbi:hypothetical protein T492DRAFT_585356 [Pavlovales sp. CCMP2436]|nr:hypothetical protein T492DRAFT_585356 [Pavlovales sp. CCMP2436]
MFARERGSNANALIQRDWYYENAIMPPRRLQLDQLPTDQAKWNAWGTCVESSCTYVPIQRRYEGYKKYGADVADGSVLFASLGERIRRSDWAAVTAAVSTGDTATKRSTAPVLVRLLRAILLGNALLISENSQDQNDAHLLHGDPI